MVKWQNKRIRNLIKNADERFWSQKGNSKDAPWIIPNSALLIIFKYSRNRNAKAVKQMYFKHPYNGFSDKRLSSLQIITYRVCLSITRFLGYGFISAVTWYSMYIFNKRTMTATQYHFFSRICVCVWFEWVFGTCWRKKRHSNRLQKTRDVHTIVDSVGRKSMWALLCVPPFPHELLQNGTFLTYFFFLLLILLWVGLYHITCYVQDFCIKWKYCRWEMPYELCSFRFLSPCHDNIIRVFPVWDLFYMSHLTICWMISLYPSTFFLLVPSNTNEFESFSKRVY